MPPAVPSEGWGRQRRGMPAMPDPKDGWTWGWPGWMKAGRVGTGNGTGRAGSSPQLRAGASEGVR